MDYTLLHLENEYSNTKTDCGKILREVSLWGQREFAALADDRMRGSYSNFPLHPGYELQLSEPSQEVSRWPGSPDCRSEGQPAQAMGFVRFKC